MKVREIHATGLAPISSAFKNGIVLEVGDAKIIFLSGQVAQNEAGEVIGTDSIAEQTEKTFENISRLLQSEGATLDDVIKTQIFLTDIKDFPIVSGIRNRYLANSTHAATLVEIKRLVLDACKIEIDVIAAIRNET